MYHGDPAFVDATNQDYHIEEVSPAIDKGVDTWVTVDMDGQARLFGETDIGADEYAPGFTVYLPIGMKP